MADEKHIRVFLDRSELHLPGVQDSIYFEGPQSDAAKRRYQGLRVAFESGYLENLIVEIKTSPSSTPELSPELLKLLEELVDSLSSESGRAIVALSVMQSCVKALAPEQSIRLHKGDVRHGGDRFSWKEGISMRSLDSNFVTPVLRKHDLIRLNADGFMMTRSLAENYPYSALYKAALRGGRSQWLLLTDELETGRANAEGVLRTLVSLLLNRTAAFQELASEAITLAAERASRVRTLNAAISWFESYVDSSAYSARVFEIAMHALYQALEEGRHLPNILKPLSQMRSANKKHGNVGDIELMVSSHGMAIVEAWDAKYGKPYLRDELEELSEKLSSHHETKIVGFVVNSDPIVRPDIELRRKEIEDMHDVAVYIMSFGQWVQAVVSRFGADPAAISSRWIMCFVESLCQKRRLKAPIDEPCDLWVSELKTALKRI